MTRSNSRRHLWLALALAGASGMPYAAGQKTDSFAAEAGDAAMLSDTPSRVVRGRELVPPGVILNLKGKSRSMVWLGSYIVNTSGCNECHTHPSYSAGEILQVMPWPAFGKMTTRDLYAVYEYLRALPSLPDNPHPGP
jgi:hypothetical protein